MNESTREAIALLGTATSGFYDPWRLAGPSMGNVRQQIVSLYSGRKVPKAKCGVTEIKKWLYATLDPQGNCIAAMDHDCVAKIAAMGFDVHPNAVL